LYCAVDKAGKTVDFFLSRQWDINAAKAFLRKVRIPSHGDQHSELMSITIPK
jgi:transposase-like protein